MIDSASEIQAELSGTPKTRRIGCSSSCYLELLLIGVVLLLSYLMHRVASYNLVVLNLFFLPVVLAAFYLGRYRAGLLAFFSAICVSIVAAVDLEWMVIHLPAPALGLGILFWGAVLGMTSLLVGTLSDEREEELKERRQTQLGLTDVLIRYLQNMSGTESVQAMRTANLCCDVARELKLKDREVQCVRAAALLQNLEHLESTAQVIQHSLKALSQRDAEEEPAFRTMCQYDRSFETVLSGAFRLLVLAGEIETDMSPAADYKEPQPLLGARVLITVRDFMDRCHCAGKDESDPQQMLQTLEEMQKDVTVHYDPIVIQAVKSVLLQRHPRRAEIGEPAETIATLPATLPGSC